MIKTLKTKKIKQLTDTIVNPEIREDVNEVVITPKENPIVKPSENIILSTESVTNTIEDNYDYPLEEETDVNSTETMIDNFNVKNPDIESEIKFAIDNKPKLGWLRPFTCENPFAT